jgi:hypothetical protein
MTAMMTTKKMATTTMIKMINDDCVELERIEKISQSLNFFVFLNNFFISTSIFRCFYLVILLNPPVRVSDVSTVYDVYRYRSYIICFCLVFV